MSFLGPCAIKNSLNQPTNQDILKKKINDDKKAELYAQTLQEYANTVKPNIEEEEKKSLMRPLLI